MIRQTIAIDRTQAVAFRAVGKRTPQGGWPPGDYAGEVAMLRDGTELGRQSVMLTVE